MTRINQNDWGLLDLAQATTDDLVANAAVIEDGRSDRSARVVTWFLPVVDHALKGGVRTAFMIAERMSRDWGTLNQIVIFSLGSKINCDNLTRSLKTHFPDLRFVVIPFRRGIDKTENLPPSDLAFCTLWTTAYLLLRYNKTRRKYYLMQDYEPNFYPAGDVSGVIEQTYRFGFSCIANTLGVESMYRRYSDDVFHFTPGVDGKVFNCTQAERKLAEPFKIVFYGRPSNARNCFGLGLRILSRVKEKLGHKVQIVSVGEAWQEKDYGVEGIVENRGMLATLEEVACLYRESHLGLVFMMTPHPSYQPFEYMACGCVVATNINESNQWLVDNTTSLQLEPIPDIAADRIVSLFNDPERWGQLRSNGLQRAAQHGWDDALDCILQHIGS